MSLVRYPRKVLIVIIIISVLGVLDAMYLSFIKISGEAELCVDGTTCNQVLSSPYSRVLGIPIAFIGFGYYLFLAVSGCYLLWRWNSRLFYALAGITGCGFVASLWLTYLQFFVIHSICTYCLLSAGVTTILFFLLSHSSYYHRKSRKSHTVGEPGESL